jgi:hypothetical protein
MDNVLMILLVRKLLCIFQFWSAGGITTKDELTNIRGAFFALL